VKTSVDSNHPTRLLAFFIAEDFTDETRLKVIDFVEKLATAREWLIGAPEIVDELVQVEVGPGLVVGGCLEVYSSYRGENLPREVDLLQLEEAEFLLKKVEEFSKANQVDFDVEYNREIIGQIEGGVMDDMLAEGYLGEWRRSLEIAS